MVLHEGWVILSFADKPALSGLLRYERVGDSHQWVLGVPAGQRHGPYVAIIAPKHIVSVTPCTEIEAIQHAQRAQPAPPPPSQAG